MGHTGATGSNGYAATSPDRHWNACVSKCTRISRSQRLRAGGIWPRFVPRPQVRSCYCGRHCLRGGIDTGVISRGYAANPISCSLPGKRLSLSTAAFGTSTDAAVPSCARQTGAIGNQNLRRTFDETPRLLQNSSALVGDLSLCGNASYLTLNERFVVYVTSWTRPKTVRRNTKRPIG